MAVQYLSIYLLDLLVALHWWSGDHQSQQASSFGDHECWVQWDISRDKKADWPTNDCQRHWQTTSPYKQKRNLSFPIFMLSSEKCQLDRCCTAQLLCSLQHAQSSPYIELYMPAVRENGGVSNLCVFLCKETKALSLAMGPQGFQCVVRVTWLYKQQQDLEWWQDRCPAEQGGIWSTAHCHCLCVSLSMCT